MKLSAFHLTSLHALQQPLLPTPQPAPVPAVSTPHVATGVPFEPHCLMTWAEQCAGMDDMAGAAR
jgi:hypothetical protein